MKPWIIPKTDGSFRVDYTKACHSDGFKQFMKNKASNYQDSPGKTSETRSIRLPKTHWEHSRVRAKKTGITVNAYVRSLIEADINRSKEK